MPNTKCALIRQKVIDRCLSSDRDYSIPKLMKRCNKALEVRTIWDDEREKWFFFMLNAIGTANEQDDYAKTRNYRKCLKNKLKAEGSEVIVDNLHNVVIPVKPYPEMDEDGGYMMAAES